MTHRRFTLVLLALAGLTLAGCSVQEIALVPISIIRGRIEVPDGMRALTIRVNRVGTTTERTPVTAESAFTDVEGDFLLETNKLGGGFVVARGVEFDIGFSPVFLAEYGETVDLALLLPEDGPRLRAKTPGEALFLVFEEDFEPDFGPIQRIDVVGPDGFDLDDTALALHDDGSLFDIDPVEPGMQVSGDVAAGDKVWTLRVPPGRFSGGQQEYGFFINENLDEGLQRDPYEEAEGDDGSVILIK